MLRLSRLCARAFAVAPAGHEILVDCEDLLARHNGHEAVTFLTQSVRTLDDREGTRHDAGVRGSAPKVPQLRRPRGTLSGGACLSAPQMVTEIRPALRFNAGRGRFGCRPAQPSRSALAADAFVVLNIACGPTPSHRTSACWRPQATLLTRQSAAIPREPAIDATEALSSADRDGGALQPGPIGHPRECPVGATPTFPRRPTWGEMVRDPARRSGPSGPGAATSPNRHRRLPQTL